MNTIVHLSTRRGPAGHKRTRVPIAVWSVDDLTPPSNENWLADVIEDEPYFDVALSLWVHHPNIREATNSLASLLPVNWPGKDGDSLLVKIIGLAVTHVRDAVGRGETFEARIIGVYLFWLVSQVAEIASTEILGIDSKGEMLRWPLFSEPIHTWASRNGIRKVEAYQVAVPVNDEEMAGLRTHLVARITKNPIDAGYLERHAPKG